MSRPLAALQVGWTLWAAIWLAASLWSRRTLSRPPLRTNGIHLPLTAAGFVGLLIVLPPRGFMTAPLWQLPSALEWAMVALLAAAIALSLWARFELGSLWSASVTRKEAHRLVDTGPYAITRHPIYTALIAGGLATAAVKASPLALLGFVLLTGGFFLKARLEERFLGAELGEADYAAYRGRVPMLVPLGPVDRMAAGR